MARHTASAVMRRNALGTLRADTRGRAAYFFLFASSVTLCFFFSHS